MTTERLGVGDLFLERMDAFLARSEQHEAFAFQRAMQAVDTALDETLKYIEAEQLGRDLPTTKEELSKLWKEASRLVTPLDAEFAQACYYKALGWMQPQDWAKAKQLGINTDTESIKAERLKLIKKAQLADFKQKTDDSWFRWVTDKEHRERLTFVGGALAAVVLGIWTVFVYLDGKNLFASSVEIGINDLRPRNLYKPLKLRDDEFESFIVIMDMLIEKKGSGTANGCKSELLLKPYGVPIVNRKAERYPEEYIFSMPGRALTMTYVAFFVAPIHEYVPDVKVRLTCDGAATKWIDVKLPDPRTAPP